MPSEVHMDSMKTPGKLQELSLEFTWTPDGVHKDVWLSVTSLFIQMHRYRSTSRHRDGVRSRVTATTL